MQNQTPEYAMSLLDHEAHDAQAEAHDRLLSPVQAIPIVNPAFVGVNAVAVPVEYKE
jgi:hypothetical protein